MVRMENRSLLCRTPGSDPGVCGRKTLANWIKSVCGTDVCGWVR